MTHNPLSQYYRTRVAGLEMALPSGGNYGGDIHTNIAGLVNIYALTASDEIYVTNPDSLITGSAIHRIIESSCPSVHDIANLPIQDVDVICLATKKLSYGPIFTINGKCEKCGTEQNYNINIDAIFSKATSLPTEMICEVDGLKIYLRPYTFQISNYIASKEFEENKLIEYLGQDSNLSEDEKTKEFFKSLQKIQMLNLNTNQKCIIRIITPDGVEVVDEEFIKEFIDNAPLKTTKAIISKIKEFNNYGLPKTFTVECTHSENDVPCGHKQDIPLVYDPTSFFV